ncbi:hypothetical protein BKA62DRAFT_773248 [Auriculariales sp. MPI-PUGE-AT-0066]|nr:hypothetical protein BKA62DRAFT_773248 [Auriculariales sp. MPI-PUGE-AT-0066]
MAHAGTPARKVVRWAYELANSSLGSPPHVDASLNDASLDSDVEADHGALAQVNAQLLAHGFSHGEGIKLEGLDAQSQKMVVKCIMDLLRQRANETTRTEAVTTKYRTLSYDHERLLSLHSTQLDKTARAEQDTQRMKTRVAQAQRDAASAEAQRKAVASDLARARTAMQTLRTTAQQEAKRLEKDRQTFADKFTKISDAQVQLGYAQAGIQFIGEPANHGRLMDLPDDGEMDILESSLRTAEEARRNLMHENEGLREVVLDAARRLQEATHDAMAMRKGPDALLEDLHAITAGQLFSPPTSTLTNAENAQQKLVDLSNNFRDALSSLGNSTSFDHSETEQKKSVSDERQAEVDKLKQAITKLTGQLGQAKKEAATFSAQSQELFDRLKEHEAVKRDARHKGADTSIDMGQLNEAARAVLEAEREELDAERLNFTEAAVRLGRQRAELEAAQLAFIEEKREWQIQQIMGQVPATKSKPRKSLLPAPAAAASMTSMPSVPFPSSSLESLLRPQVGEVTTSGATSKEPVKVPSPTEVDFTVPAPSKSSRRSPKGAKHVAFAVTSPTSVAHMYSPARPSPLSRIMMMADDSDIVEPEDGDPEYTTDEEDATAPTSSAPVGTVLFAKTMAGTDEQEMFPMLASAQRSPTRAEYPPLPEDLAVELQLGASGHRTNRRSIGAGAWKKDSQADVSFPPPSSVGRVSFEFAVQRPSGPRSRESDDDEIEHRFTEKEKGKMSMHQAQSSMLPGNSSDELDEDLKIVKGPRSKPRTIAPEMQSKDANTKENKRPTTTAKAAKTLPPTKARVPLSPRKATSAPGVAAKTGTRLSGPKRVPVAPAAAPTVARKLSPILIPAAPAVPKTPPQITRGPIRGAQRITGGWR